MSSASTAWPIRAGISAAGTPSASSSPARRLRLCGASAVATRSPVPASPIIDSGRAARSSANRHTSRKMWPAAAPAAFMPCASVAPAASAAAFLADPGSSTPTGSLDCSHTTPARMNTSAIVSASRGPRSPPPAPAPSRDHLARVRRAADARDPVRAERLREQRRRRQPVRRHQPLGERDHRRLAPEAGRLEAGDHLVEPARRHAEEHVVGARQARRHRLDPQLARQLDSGQVLAVLAVGLEPLGLLGRARLERRPEPAAREQHRDGGAERARRRSRRRGAIPGAGIER